MVKNKTHLSNDAPNFLWRKTNSQSETTSFALLPAEQDDNTAEDVCLHDNKPLNGSTQQIHGPLGETTPLSVCLHLPAEMDVSVE